jgi:hypothetical protein
MDPKDRVALEITTALIRSTPEILKGNDPQFIDRRIKSAFELLDRVSLCAKQRSERGS